MPSFDSLVKLYEIVFQRIGDVTITVTPGDLTQKFLCIISWKKKVKFYFYSIKIITQQEILVKKILAQVIV